MGPGRLVQAECIRSNLRTYLRLLQYFREVNDIVRPIKDRPRTEEGLARVLIFRLFFLRYRVKQAYYCPILLGICIAPYRYRRIAKVQRRPVTVTTRLVTFWTRQHREPFANAFQTKKYQNFEVLFFVVTRRERTC